MKSWTDGCTIHDLYSPTVPIIAVLLDNGNTATLFCGPSVLLSNQFFVYSFEDDMILA